MYYSKISGGCTGFTNQIFALITSIINAYKKGEKVVVVDNFLNDISEQTSYTPISDILDLKTINNFLEKTYDIIIVDKNYIQFEIVSINYGTTTEKYTILTDYFKEHNFNNSLFINKNIVFNDIKGDPDPGILKKLSIKYKINDYYIEEVYNEQLESNIQINCDGPYKFTLGWIDTFNNSMFDKILTNITYNIDFILKSHSITNRINIDNKVNVIHLRLEDDGIIHWSKQNQTTPELYKKYLEEKYISIIEKYILVTDETIILSSSINNGVINFLAHNRYKYIYIHKFFNQREKDAIVDLLVSKVCNNVFIGNFNMHKLNGSTFSYYIWKTMSDTVRKVYIDLDRVYDKEVIVN